MSEEVLHDKFLQKKEINMEPNKKFELEEGREEGRRRKLWRYTKKERKSDESSEEVEEGEEKNKR